MLVFQFILPIVINLISNIVVLFVSKKSYRLIILIPSVVLLAASLLYAYIQTPELIVVPDFKHQWVDQAVGLCKKVGLRPNVERGTYTLKGRKNEIQWQSLEPGALVFANSSIEIRVCLGGPVGDSLYGYTYDQVGESKEREENK